MEDEPLVQQLIEATLRRFDPYIKIDSFKNGNVALSRYREAGPYDLVITDHGHPGLWGIDFIEAVRILHVNQPVILQTGNSGNHIEDFERKWKDISVIAKPWPAEQFLQLVSASLRGGDNDPRRDRNESRN